MKLKRWLFAASLALALVACDGAGDATPPSVALDLTSGAAVLAGSEFTISATSPSSGVQRVNVELNTRLIASQNFSPTPGTRTFSVAIPQNAEAGVRVLQATAVDANGRANSSSVTVTVVASSSGDVPGAPSGDGITATWYAPTVGSSFSGPVTFALLPSASSAITGVSFELLDSAEQRQGLGAATLDPVTGLYSRAFNAGTLTPGVYALHATVFTADGARKTFARSFTVTVPQIDLEWYSPAPSSTFAGIVSVVVKPVSVAGIASVSMKVVAAGGIEQSLLVSGFPSGEYLASVNANELAPGSYTLSVTVTAEGGAKRDFTRAFSVAASSVTATWSAPSAGENIAGVVRAQLHVTPASGVQSVSMVLDGPAGLRQVVAVSDQGAGVFETIVNTLTLMPGTYTLTATVTPTGGAAQSFPQSFKVLEPFEISSPTNGATVSPRLLAVAVAANGTVLSSGVRITSAEIFINNQKLDDIDVNSATDNQALSYGWNTGVSVPGVHDATLAGDRIIAVKIVYDYEDETGATVFSASRFTPGVKITYQP
jgi:uncharacterized membrane protein